MLALGGTARRPSSAGGAPLIEGYHSNWPDGVDEYNMAVLWWDATAEKGVGLFCASFVDQGCAPRASEDRFVQIVAGMRLAQ